MNPDRLARKGYPYTLGVGTVQAFIATSGERIYVIPFGAIEAVWGTPGDNVSTIRSRSGDETTVFVPFDDMLKVFNERAGGQ